MIRFYYYNEISGILQAKKMIETESGVRGKVKSNEYRNSWVLLCEWNYPLNIYINLYVKITVNSAYMQQITYFEMYIYIYKLCTCSMYNR